MEKLAYTPEEAAAATGLGRTSIFEALRGGRLERRKAGARTLIPAKSLRAFLAALPRGGCEPEAARGYPGGDSVAVEAAPARTPAPLHKRPIRPQPAMSRHEARCDMNEMSPFDDRSRGAGPTDTTRPLPPADAPDPEATR